MRAQIARPGSTAGARSPARSSAPRRPGAVRGGALARRRRLRAGGEDGATRALLHPATEDRRAGAPVDASRRGRPPPRRRRAGRGGRARSPQTCSWGGKIGGEPGKIRGAAPIIGHRRAGGRPESLVPAMPVLAIDAGTTGVTALVVGEHGDVLARGYREFAQLFPRPGWVEHEPDDIWTATVAACRRRWRPPTRSRPASASPTSARRRWSGTAARCTRPRPAIVWQDRRTTGICDRLRDEGGEERVAELTGLRLDPYFTGTKYALAGRGAAALGRRPRRLAGAGHRRLLRDRPADRRRRARHRRHQRQPHPAVRPRQGRLVRRAVRAVRRPAVGAARARAELRRRGTTDPDAFLGLELPIAGIAGDQQAALFGQACYSPGDQVTYGTGSFVLTNTGPTPVRSDAGLLTTVAGTWATGWSTRSRGRSSSPAPPCSGCATGWG